MLDERSAAALAKAGDNIDYSGRNTYVTEPVRHFERGERGLLGRFQDAGASGSKRGRQLPGGHQQGIVPRNNLSGNADRFFQREAEGVVGNGIHVAQNLGGQTAVVFEAGSHVGDVEFGLDNRLAAIACFQFGEHGGIGAYFLGQTQQHAPPLLGGGAGPWALVKSGAGCANRAVHVICIGVGNLRNDFFGGGIVDRESLPGRALDPLAINVQLVSFDFSLYSSGHKDLLRLNALGHDRALREICRGRFQPAVTVKEEHRQCDEA